MIGHDLATTDYSLAHSLPANVEAERSILGAILLDNFAYNQAAEHLKPEDFSLDSHRRIYTRMMDLAESSRPIDMITLVEEFDRHKELEAIGDVGYISGLVDGVPDRPSIEHYIKIVRDKALMRGLIHVSNSAIARAADQSDPAEEVLNDAEAAIMQLSEKRIGRGFMGVQEIVKESFGSVDALLQRGQRITGLATHYTDLDEMTSGFQRSDLIIIAARPSMGKTAFAMNIAENASIEDQTVVGMVSQEMSREPGLLRVCGARARGGAPRDVNQFFHRREADAPLSKPCHRLAPTHHRSILSPACGLVPGIVRSRHGPAALRPQPPSLRRKPWYLRQLTENFSSQ